MAGEQLIELAAACAVRVDVACVFAGSGVLVAPGEVLTCAHVIAAAVRTGAAITVRYGGRDWPVQVRALDPAPPAGEAVPSPYGWPDLAWLTVPGLTGHSWVELDTAPPRARDELVGYGFSEAFAAGTPAGHPAAYRVDGPVDLNDGRRWQLSAAQAAPGMSGTGLINTATGRLAGLLTRTRNADTDLGGWAVHTVPPVQALPVFTGLRGGHAPARGADRDAVDAWRRNYERWLNEVGHRALLAEPYEPLPTDPTPGTMLLAHHGVVPFHAEREVDLALLRERFAERQDAPLAQLMVAPAGTGKTRLAAELAYRLSEDGWLTGFLKATADPAALHPLARRGNPLLLVADYAESRARLADLLVEAVVVARQGCTVRVLLLARTATEWWRSLPGSAKEEARVVERIIDHAQVVRLGQLDQIAADPTPAYRDAAFALAARQRLPAPLELPVLDRKYAWSYLSAHLAALDAVGTRDRPGRANPAGTPRSPSDVLDSVLHRERRHWRRTADADRMPDVDDTVLARTVTALTLVGATDENDAANALALVPDLSAASDEGRRRALARWVKRHYPPDRDSLWTRGLQPDLLAARQILALADDADVVHKLLVGLHEARREQAVALLQRATQNYPDLSRLLVPFMERNRDVLEPAAVAAVARATGRTVGTEMSVSEIYASFEVAERKMMWEQWTSTGVRPSSRHEQWEGGA